MHLKIHATFPGSEFNMSSSLNLLPFPALLNKLFRRVPRIQQESSRALTLQQARQLHLFDRGWLPRILPASTHQLQLLNNPQLNCAQGEFYFSPDDWADFSAKLRPEKILEAPFINWANGLRKMQGDGHSLWHYPQPDRHWVFFCKAEQGYCEYVMWTCQDAAL
jgi:hypothetical protein